MSTATVKDSNVLNIRQWHAFIEMDLTTNVVDFKLLSKYLQRHGKIMSIYESVYMRFHMAITESPNGEPGNRMTGMRAMGVGM